MKTKTTKPAVTTYDVAWYVHERDIAPGGSPIARPGQAGSGPADWRPSS